MSCTLFQSIFSQTGWSFGPRHFLGFLGGKKNPLFHHNWGLLHWGAFFLACRKPGGAPSPHSGCDTPHTLFFTTRLFWAFFFLGPPFFGLVFRGGDPRATIHCVSAFCLANSEPPRGGKCLISSSSTYFRFGGAP